MEYDNGNLIQKFGLNILMVLEGITDIITTPLEWLGLDESTKEDVISYFWDIWKLAFDLTNVFNFEQFKSSWSNVWIKFKTWWESTIVYDFFDNFIGLFFKAEKWQMFGSRLNDAWSIVWSSFKIWWNGTIGNWWTQNVYPWFTIEKWSNLVNNAKNGALNKFYELKNNASNQINELMNNISRYFSYQYWYDKTSNMVNGILNKIREFRNSAIEALKLPEITIPRIKLPHFWLSYDYSTWGNKALAFLGLPAIPKINISWYANGGFPDAGQLFVANEAGAELVGSMDGKTAVANNQQIISGITAGVEAGIRNSNLNNNNSSQPINLTVNIGENKLIRQIINGINEVTRQTGEFVFDIPN